MEVSYRKKPKLFTYVEDSKALLNGLWLHHESGDPGHDVRAVVAGPVAEDALHL